MAFNESLTSESPLLMYKQHIRKDLEKNTLLRKDSDFPLFYSIRPNHTQMFHH